MAYLGYIDQARSRRNAALFEAHSLGHANSLASVLNWANWMDAIIRSPELQGHAEELLVLSTEHGFSLFSGRAIACRGRSLAALGQAREGLALLTLGLAAIRATGAVANTPRLLIWIADAHAMLGEPDEALNCLAETAQIIATTEERADEAELYRLLGDLLRAKVDRAAAEYTLARRRIKTPRPAGRRVSASLPI